MTEIELKKLNRAELLTMLMSLTQKCEDLEEELRSTGEQLKKRTVQFEEAGTLAEAMVRVNGVLEAADRAAEEYLENIRTQNAAAMESLEKKRAEREAAIASEMAQQSEKLERLCGQVKEQEELLAGLEKSHRERMEEIEQETQKRCAAMVEDAKAQSQSYWDEVYARAKEFCRQGDDLQGLLERLRGAGNK